MLQSVADISHGKKSNFIPEKEVFMVQDEVENVTNDHENFLNHKALSEEKMLMSQIILKNLGRSKKKIWKPGKVDFSKKAC